ncbi:MAG: LuxR C-terminal-related transcriptional regulator [Candidatus Cybelea sp.]|jgi:LuxR family transcriptional regulator, maltose regulon positive regulatory protein
MVQTLRREDRSDAGAFAHIGRPRVVERLAASATHPIALLIAPAGYGKSVALRQYLSSLSEPHVRFALRSDHATLLSFLRGLAEALSESAPHAITALAGAYEGNTASPKRGAELAHWMHAHLESFRGVIAIDDLHVADGDPEVAGFLTSLIERTKGRIRWVLASRSTAGLPLGTWQAYRDLDLPVDEQALRFTFEEACEAATAMGLRIRDEELSDLLRLTEGWPAAVSFALRTSTRSSDLRNVSAVTREMIYRFLAEQVYTTLDRDERDLLEVAIALPIIDAKVLERAGFDDALPIVERLRERTAFIYEEAEAVYQCHDLFREFLRHQSAMRGKRSQQIVHERAAHALEESGDVEHAIAAYITAAALTDVVRLLERSGFALLERARSDVVARAIEALADGTRQENATVLALQGALQAISGKFARAESLLRRSLTRAGNDRELVAMTSLRLASLIANQGGDVAELLGAVGDDLDQSAAHRAEALSLIAGQKAVRGETAAARTAAARVEPLLSEIDSDVVRAKVLHHIGIAFHHLGEADRAFEVLTHASELAEELHLYGLASRVNAVLSNLALHEEDDVDKQLRYAEAAATAATKAGDAFALQIALLQMLSAQMRRGDVEKSIAIEQRLATIRTHDLAGRYLTLFRSVRLGWEGRFAEAQQLVSASWAHMPFDFDRILSGSVYALFLSLDGQPQLSVKLIREILEYVSTSEVTGLFRVRSMAIARALCALAEAINGRTTSADRVLREVKSSGDGVILLTGRVVDSIMARLRHRGESGVNRIRASIDALSALGYADVARLLAAVDRVIGNGLLGSVPPAELTPSEIGILRLLAEGLTPKEIAEQRDGSVHTVRVHIANVIAKLDCHGRSEAIRTAQRLGLI